jgi:hypothetical protein
VDAHRLTQPVSLLGRRSRRQLVDTLLRAHRNGDSVLVRLCQKELDERNRECAEAAPRVAVPQRQSA